MSGDRRERFSVNRVDTDEHQSEDNVAPVVGTPREDPEAALPSSEHPTVTRKYSLTRESSLTSNYNTISDQHLTAHSSSTWRSLRHHLTRDALPKIDHYRNLMSIVAGGASASQRPTLDDLHRPPADKIVLVEGGAEDDAGPASGGAPAEGSKQGWIKGVLIRCLLNIWGVMLFLRLSWVTGQAGILEGLLVVTCGNVVTVLTSLSMAAIATNGQIKGGGTYYMISRSLGPEFGGAIGAIFSFANAVACSMYVVGFCESLSSLLSENGLQIFDGGINDGRLVGSLILVVLLVICVLGGMEWEARAQIFLLLVLLLAMIAFVIGVFVGPLNDDEVSRGFVGLSSDLGWENFYSDYRFSEGKMQNFFTVFAIFFPACTGILAGANISGDLKDPSGAISKGTLLAIVITYFSYLLFVVLTGCTVTRDASGNVTEIADLSFLNCTGRECNYGLHNSFQVMELVSVFGPIIYAGCFAATLSSAMASLVSAPKVFQALCNDYLFPYIHVFARGYGKNNEPFRAYGLTFIIALAFILIGELNSIAPIISNFFLAAYALINFSTFHASLQRVPSWRPDFKYYNMWLSLVGAILCTAVMILIEWWTALLTGAIIFILYLVIHYRKPDANWGSSTQAQTYNEALGSVIALGGLEDHVKTYRPQLLVLAGAPRDRPPLLHFANTITKNMSLLVVGHYLKDPAPPRVKRRLTDTSTRWLQHNKIRAFYAVADGPSVYDAARSLMANVGLGKLKPNVVLMGYKSDWKEAPREDLLTYFNIIHSAFDQHLSVGLLRVREGLDFSSLKEDLDNSQIKDDLVNGQVQEEDDRRSMGAASSTGSLATLEESVSMLGKTIWVGLKKLTKASPNKSPVLKTETRLKGLPKGMIRKKERTRVFRGPSGEVAAPQVIDAMLQFTKKRPSGSTIDVWWLYDDGGLTILLPYILTTRSVWAACKLRVLCLANSKVDFASEARRMAELLCKFRIEYTDVIIIPDVQKPPQPESSQAFESLIRPFRVRDTQNSSEEHRPDIISEAELTALKDKTNRHIRLRELLLQHSHDAALVVMTLPIPVQGTVSAPLYLAWLETLTKDMPPFLLVRGNQTSVLTFYS
ncbi:bumetanide-sensitive sodium-(potassium)-chloride cotransporter-like isoform X2 [Oratosquilla oratoria]|uniref:bumetanide-sensitive sodium-(potassium)-chloride cotransporter-like isoform X2 n=1 Tax=Oratosquilla oratoria TaxID=337810 RepID=UPI003F76919B